MKVLSYDEIRLLEKRVEQLYNAELSMSFKDRKVAEQKFVEDELEKFGFNRKLANKLVKENLKLVIVAINSAVFEHDIFDYIKSNKISKLLSYAILIGLGSLVGALVWLQLN